MANLKTIKHSRNDHIQNNNEMEEELGRGIFSIVYTARSKQTHKYHAVKVIEKKKLGVKKIEMIETEILLMKKVGGHPNIISLEDTFENNFHVFIVMELITGGELFDKIVELQYYSEKEASKIIQQVLSAIDHLHTNQVVHRDLKPENLLLSSKEDHAQVKLADFGLSTALPEHGKLTKAVGTPGYIAPEILKTLDGDLDGYSKEVDLFSVGVIMYILLCGFPPFYGEDDDEAFDKTIAGDFDYPEPYWKNISSTAKDLINHLLVVDPAARYTTKEALKHPWIAANNEDKHLDFAIEQLKKFNAKKRWKKGMNAVLAMGRFKHISLNNKKEDEQHSPKSSPTILQEKEKERSASPVKVKELSSEKSKLTPSSPEKTKSHSPTPDKKNPPPSKTPQSPSKTTSTTTTTTTSSPKSKLSVVKKVVVKKK